MRRAWVRRFLPLLPECSGFREVHHASLEGSQDRSLSLMPSSPLPTLQTPVTCWVLLCKVQCPLFGAQRGSSPGLRVRAVP